MNIKARLRQQPNDLQPLAALYQGQVLELNEAWPEGADPSGVHPLTLRDEEGRRVYERSLRFVLLLAVHRLWPGQRVRLKYSVGRGVLFELPGLPLEADMVDALSAEMKAITQADLPFERSDWPLDRAIAYFADLGQADKVDLLHRRQKQVIRMYGCGGIWEYFYGAMVPSTGAVSVFALQPMSGGAILFMPEPKLPLRVAPYVEQRKHLRIFAESEHWCDILGVNDLTDLAGLAETGQLRRFIRVNEALHERSLSEMASRIVGGDKQIVLVAGPSSSGKTTFAGRLGVHIQVQGHHATRISLDDYYLDRDTIPREADGSIDLESIHTLDIPLLQAHLSALLAGDWVTLPRFSFSTGRREKEGRRFRLEKGDTLILEGIHALNPLLTDRLPQEKLHRVFVSALTCLNLDDHNRIRTTDVRLLRRIVRDMQFRGTRPEETLAMWDSVRRGEDRWIFPYQEQADDMFNTALHYELPFLKRTCYQLLLAVPENDPNAVLAGRLRKLMNYVPDIDPALLSEVPPLSLLREFIGGCTMELEG